MANLRARDDIVLHGQVEIALALIEQVTKQPATVKWHQDYAEIILNPQQKDIVRTHISNALAARKPGRIRLNTLELVAPPVLKTYGKLAIVLLILIFFVGRLSAR